MAPTVCPGAPEVADEEEVVVAFSLAPVAAVAPVALVAMAGCSETRVPAQLVALDPVGEARVDVAAVVEMGATAAAVGVGLRSVFSSSVVRR
jgi:hypothetical protein